MPSPTTAPVQPWPWGEGEVEKTGVGENSSWRVAEACTVVFIIYISLMCVLSAYLANNITGIARIFSKLVLTDIVEDQARGHLAILVIINHHGEVILGSDDGGAHRGLKLVPGDRGDWDASHLTAERGGVAGGLSYGLLGGVDGWAVLHQQGDVNGFSSTQYRTHINSRIRSINSDQRELLAVL